MAENQTKCSKLEKKSVIEVLVAEKCKPCEIHGRMDDVYGEVCLSQKYLQME